MAPASPVDLLLWMGLAALVLLRAWLTLGQGALEEISESVARRRAADGDRRAGALCRLLEEPALAAALPAAGALLVLLVAGLTGGLARWQPPWQEPGLYLGVLAALALAGEMLPRLAGRLRAETWAYRLAPGLLGLARALALPLALLPGLPRAGADGPGGQTLGRSVTVADLQATAGLGEASGEVEPEVGRMFDEVMELGETRVREVMTPRVDIVGVPAGASAREVLEVAIASGFSRLPAYEGNLDQVVGVVHIHDLLPRLLTGEADLTARAVARPPLLTPEARPLGEMLRVMREQATHLALVVGDAGGIEGLVTIEDILEELVGEISDEHDLPEIELLPVGPGELLAPGRVRLEQVAEALGVELPPTEAETVAGLLFALSGEPPAPGADWDWGGLRLQVEEVDGRQVTQVRISRIAEDPS